MGLMNWVSDLFSGLWDAIGNYIDQASTLQFVLIVGGLLVILAVAALLGLWFYILFKGTHHGGYH